jgi:hypothetical protein
MLINEQLTNQVKSGVSKNSCSMPVMDVHEQEEGAELNAE